MVKQHITFVETMDHLGGIWVLGGIVLMLFVFYLFLVEYLMPRRRSRALQRQRYGQQLRQKTK